MLFAKLCSQLLARLTSTSMNGWTMICFHCLVAMTQWQTISQVAVIFRKKDFGVRVYHSVLEPSNIELFIYYYFPNYIQTPIANFDLHNAFLSCLESN